MESDIEIEENITPQNPKSKEDEKKTKCLKENCITCAFKDSPEKETIKDKTTIEKTTKKDSDSDVKVKPKLVQCKFCPKKISEGADMADHIKQMWPGHLANMPRIKKKYF